MRPIAEHRQYADKLPLSCSEGGSFDFMAHWHPDVELYWVRRGRVQVGINGDTRILEPGWLAVCGTNDIHHYRKIDDAGRAQMVIFRPELAGYPGIWPAERSLTGAFWSPETVEPLVPSLKALEAEFSRPDLFQPQVARGLITVLCGLMDRHLTVAGTAPAPRGLPLRERMGKSIEFIRSNSRRDISLGDVAREVNMSPWYFSRVFAASTGHKFTRYLAGVRLEDADELLATTDATMVDIALECGFGSVRSLNRVWRELREGSPRSSLARG